MAMVSHFLIKILLANFLRLFHLQGVLILLAALLVSFKMRVPQSSVEQEPVAKTILSKLKRIDFLGILFLGTSIFAGMLLLEMGGKNFSWTSPLTFVLILVSISSGILFVLTEVYFADFPIFSLHLLKVPDVVLGYAIMHLQMIAQSGLMFFVPVYFQVTARATAAKAGSHLVPAVVGNAVGGLLSGLIIKRTGRYKSLVVSAGLIAAIAYSLLLLRWKGHTGFWESLYIFPGGFGTGVAQAAVFITVTGAIEDSETATVISGLMLVVSIGFAEGVTFSSSVLDFVFGRTLRQRLTGPGSEEVSCYPSYKY
jgi:predicted MFS family arabinose efflux permease